MDIGHLKNDLSDIRNKAVEFFSNASNICGDTDAEFNYTYPKSYEASEYWVMLNDEQHSFSTSVQKDLLKVVSQVIPLIKNSLLLNEADERDIGICTKRIRSALQLRKFRSWDAQVLHDEDIVLGVHPPGQSDDQACPPLESKKDFDSGIGQLLSIIELIEATPVTLSDGLPLKNPNLSQIYRPNTAFIMMRISPSQPETEDVYDVYKECFNKFDIKAIRADDIEHEDVITDRILEEIKTSEFLLGDLTYERPSVYYEIGYAHSLRRRVIMYRKKDTQIHFDLAAYNCPEYENMRELRDLLLKRLESTTNKSTINR
jgi:hypothetical protein